MMTDDWRGKTMRKKLLPLITFMIIASMTIPAGGSAQSPYPPPEPSGHIITDNGGNGRSSPRYAPDLQQQAYPPPVEPGPGLPGIEVFEPDDPDPRPGVPYVWGIFFDTDGDRKVFVTIDTGFPEFSMEGIVCIIEFMHYTVHCLDLHPHHYNGQLGRTSFHSDPIRYCDTWAVQYANLGGMAADIRQPNTYTIRCIFLPWLRKYIY